jgi:hypothetical protein
MKLSPAKVEQLVDNLIDELAEIEGVMFQGTDGQLIHAMTEIMTDELMIEEKLDAEVHQMLQAHKSEITMKRLSYDDLFKKTKQHLIKERKLVL